MQLRRLRELMVGHALAAGEPLGDALRQVGGPGAAAAAVEAEAGRLDVALRIAGLSPDEARLAQACPEALAPAQERLGRIPAATVTRVQVVETAAYLCAVALVQGAALLLLASYVTPILHQMMAEGAGPARAWLGWFAPVGLGLVTAGPLLLAASIVGIWKPAFHPGTSRWLQQAREASVAAGLAVAEASAELRRPVWQSFRHLRPEHATAAELDRVIDEALARAEQAGRRLVAGMRWIGLTAMVAIGGSATVCIYRFLAWMSP